MGRNTFARQLTRCHLVSRHGKQSGGKNTGRYPRHIQEVRARAKADQDLPQIELKGLDEALATMNEATGLGADRFGPVSSSPCQKMEDRGLLISSMNARNKLLGLGRCMHRPWHACSPRK